MLPIPSYFTFPLIISIYFPSSTVCKQDNKNVGTNIKVIASTIDTKANSVRQSLNELMENGYIYSTIDDDHSALFNNYVIMVC